MTDSPSDGPAPTTVAMRWVSRITSISIEMVLPGLLGLWLDRRLGTLVLFTSLGFALGLTVAMFHLVRIGSEGSDGPAARNGTPSPPDAGKP